MAAPVVIRRRALGNFGEDGTVTAEAAVVLPIIAAFALSLMWMLSIGIAKIETVDAARDAARAVARGDDLAQAVEIASRTAPPKASISVDEGSDGVVTVRVSVDARPPGWLLAPFPTVSVGSQATTLVERDSP